MMNILTATFDFFLFLTVCAWLAPLFKRYPLLGAMGILLFVLWVGIDKIIAVVGLVFKIGIVLFIFAVILATVASYDKNKRDLYLNPNDEDNDY